MLLDCDKKCIFAGFFARVLYILYKNIKRPKICSSADSKKRFFTSPW